MSNTVLLESRKFSGKRARDSVKSNTEAPKNQFRHKMKVNTILTIPATSKNKYIHFLIDSGADISVLPRTIFPPDSTTNNRELISANNVKIKTFGEKLLQFHIPVLNEDFQSRFTVADIRRPILGSDF